ncbi:hypothetical protein L9F63_015792, partial [Diploptera punctata]
KPITLNDLLDILDTCDDKIPESGVDVTLMPPLNANDDLTDEDSGPEDDPNIDNLPASQLNSCMEVSQDITNLTNNTSSVSITLESESGSRTVSESSRALKRRCVASTSGARKRANRTWKNSDLPVVQTEWPLMYDVPENKSKTPLEYFTTFF